LGAARAAGLEESFFFNLSGVLAGILWRMQQDPPVAK
jgi:hypothetical protein